MQSQFPSADRLCWLAIQSEVRDISDIKWAGEWCDCFGIAGVVKRYSIKLPLLLAAPPSRAGGSQSMGL